MDGECVTGDAYHIHTTSTGPVDVRRSLAREIEGFVPICNGVVYAKDNGELLRPEQSPYITPERLEESRYVWFERQWDYDSDPRLRTWCTMS